MDAAAIIRQPERWSRVFGWATLAGMELGLIGPFGSYAASPSNRIAYWTGLCWLGALLLWPSVLALIARGRERGFPPAFAASLALLAGCVPLAALAAAGCWLLWPLHASGIRPLEYYGLTLLVAVPGIAVLLWLERAAAPDPASAPAAVPVPASAEGVTAVRLGLALCLQMEDHHVRVHLPAGSSLHLASLRDTVAQLAPGRGAQVHRPWWVAREAVTGWVPEGRALVLILSNGLRVPVARNRISQLRADGWLEEADRLAGR